MPSNSGIEVHADSNDTDSGQLRMQGEKILSDYVNLTRYQKRKLFWELSNIILFSGILDNTHD